MHSWLDTDVDPFLYDISVMYKLSQICLLENICRAFYCTVRDSE